MTSTSMTVLALDPPPLALGPGIGSESGAIVVVRLYDTAVLIRFDSAGGGQLAMRPGGDLQGVARANR